MAQLLAICLGGALGTGARHIVSVAMLSWLGPSFPWGTLTVNFTGSLLLGLLAQLASGGDLTSPTLRLSLTTGLMGGFTTYSTFSLETWTYLQRDAWGLASAYVLATVALCLLGTAGGMALGRWVVA